VLNVRGSFGTTAASPILLNVVLIVTLMLGQRLFPGHGLRQVWLLVGAVIVSGILQLILQAYDLHRHGIVLRPNLATDDPDLSNIRRAMLPMLVGLATVQINTFSDSLIAMACVPHPGAPAVLYFAQRLYQFPLGVFGLAFATAVFPTLSAHAAAGDLERLRGTLTRALRVVWFIGVASTLGLVVIARPLVQGAFEHGAFDAADSARVSRTLVAYALGVWSFGINHILVRCFYALGDRRTPVRISVWGVVINLTLNLALVWKLEEVGLALATTISSTVQTIWLLGALSGRIESLDWRPLLSSAARSLAAGALMVAGCLAAQCGLNSLRPRSGVLTILIVQIVVGIAAYVGAAAALRCREMRELIAR
jgi:putative peptidoglycan lipid II flippase